MKRIPQEINIPTELAAFPEAVILWPKLLRRSTPDHLRRFGISDLAFRLACQTERERRNGGHPDLRARAVIWHNIAMKCSLGKSEVQTPTEQELQRWMPGTEKQSMTMRIVCSSCGKPMRVVRDSRFSSCRKCRGASRRSEAVARGLERGEQLRSGWKLCERCNTPFESSRKDGRYCGNRCRQRASRENRQNGVSVSPGVTDKAVLGVVNA